MNRVVICCDRNGVDMVIRENAKRFFFVNHSKDARIDRYLSERGHVSVEEAAQNFKITEEYLNLMDGLSSRHPSKYWWATFLAAKNHHMSKFFDDFYSFRLLTHLLAENDDSDFLSISPSEGMARVLKKYCMNNSIPIKVYDETFSWSETAWGSTLAAAFRNAAQLLAVAYKLLVIKCVFFLKASSWSKRERKDVYLLRTWIYPNSFDEKGEYSEKIFGRLPERLIRSGEEVLVIGSIVADFFRFHRILLKMARCRRYMLLPQEYFLSFFDLLRVYVEALTNRPKVKDVLPDVASDITPLLRYHLDKECVNHFFSQLIFCPIMKRALHMVRVKTFLYTYEQNPWEKMCILALREHSPSTAIIGYQQSIVSSAKLNFNLGDGEGAAVPMPDRIVASGQVTADMLVNEKKTPKDTVFVGCALRLERFLSLEPKTVDFRKSIKKVLVPMEGVHESVALVNLAYDALKNNKEYRVVIRPHPALPIASVRNLLHFRLSDMVFNVSLSDNPDLYRDLSEADFLLYDGSTVALEAVMMGIPIICAERKSRMTVDPLCGMDHLKRTVRSAAEVIPALESFSRLDPESLAGERMRAREYIKRYFYPVTEENLRVFSG